MREFSTSFDQQELNIFYQGTDKDQKSDAERQINITGHS